MKNYWLIRVGEGGKYSEIARKNNFVAIGWNDLGDLDQVSSRDEIRKAIEKSYIGLSPAKLASQVGQVSRFYLEMLTGDIVLMPTGEGTYDVGTIGEYNFVSEPNDGCPFRHRRSIVWDTRVSKSAMSVNLIYSLGALLTIFSLNDYSVEIEKLKGNDIATPAEKPQTVRNVIKTSLLELDGQEFEGFIERLLVAMGFESEVTQYVRDKGIDVIGTLNAEGLADITLRIQVKRVRAAIGNKEVLAIRGAAAQNEHPCIITLSTFTKAAQEE